MSNRTKPRKGDPVIHHGQRHEITDFQKRAVIDDETGEARAVEFAVFENERFEVTCDASELAWSKVDEAWYLPGRLLANDERTLAAAILGQWPTAEAHHAVRAALHAVPGRYRDHVSAERLNAVVASRRLKQEEGEDDEAFQERVAAYADACIAHCEALRTARKEA